VRYLFRTYPDGVSDYLIDAILSSDPDRELFEHFQIQGAGELHARRLSWERAFWLAAFTIPVAAFLLGRLVVELIYPWYVAVRRRILARIYPRKLRLLSESIQEDVPAEGRQFVIAARKTAGLVRDSANRLDWFLQSIRRPLDRLSVSAQRLISKIDQDNPGTYVEYLSDMQTLRFVRRDLFHRGRERFEAVDQSCTAISALVSELPDAEGLDEAHEWHKAVREWRQTLAKVERNSPQSIRRIEEVAASMRRLMDQRFEDASTITNPFLEYAKRIAEQVTRFDEESKTPGSLRLEFQKAEKRLLDELRPTQAFDLIKRSTNKTNRLDELFSSCFAGLPTNPDREKEVSAEWAREDSRREASHIYTRLDLACFLAVSMFLIGVWPQLRSFYEFFLLGLHRFFSA